MWGIVFCAERTWLPRFGGMGVGGVKNVVILVAENRVRPIIERVTLSLMDSLSMSQPRLGEST